MSHLVLVGAGHVHLGLFAQLTSLTRKGHQLTVISQSSTYCYSGMAPGVLGGQYDGSDIILDIKAIVEGFGIRFIPQKVIQIDPVRKLLTLDEGPKEPYDVVSFNIGSSIPAAGMTLDSHFRGIRGAADPAGVFASGDSWRMMWSKSQTRKAHCILSREERDS
jgi:NADH dehydrogenase FAD-containing subunit